MLENFHVIIQTFEEPYKKFQGFEIFHEKFHYVRPALVTLKVWYNFFYLIIPTKFWLNFEDCSQKKGESPLQQNFVFDISSNIDVIKV